MGDFFISYTGADRAWAEWIAFVLEEEGATSTIQAWDFRPGNNFVLAMHEAAKSSKRTIAVLSPDYQRSRFAAPEWAAAFAQDPEGTQGTLIPVRVRDCRLEGLLPAIVFIDLVGLAESVARSRLVEGLLRGRDKPDRRPPFPGAMDKHHSHPPFPGDYGARPEPPSVASIVYAPKLRGAVTDLERSEFVSQAFASIASYFASALIAIGQQSGVDTRFTRVSMTKFTAEVFVQGKRRIQCKVWLGGLFGRDQISYYEGELTDGENAMNECLGLASNDLDLAFRAMMNTGSGVRDLPARLNPNHMSPDEAGEFLWRRFLVRVQ